jgi:hypothetical protein
VRWLAHLSLRAKNAARKNLNAFTVQLRAAVLANPDLKQKTRPSRDGLASVRVEKL